MMTLSRSKKWLAALLALIMTMSFAWSASAAESAKTVQIRVKVGSNQMKIGGESIKIQPPFKSAGYVMVPLSVFTNAKGLGATVKLTNSKVITLTYQKQSVIMTKGSKAAKLNGKKFDLPVAPVDKQGVTMVPLAALVKAIGVKLTTDAKTKELVITGTAAGAAGAGTGIDSDAGKSQIGDSYFEWTMNYPTGLVQDFQSENGNILVFRDVKKEYYLAVVVEEAKEPLSVTEKRERLTGYVEEGETIVDKRTVNGASGSYEKMTTKNKQGFYYEMRGIQANGFLYIFTFGKKASSVSELADHTAILDSFKTSFNRNDKKTKDLTKIVNGYKFLTNEDYGFSVRLPKEWWTDTEVVYPYYFNDEAYLYLDVSSPSEGDTIDAWIERSLKRFADTFAAAYGKVVERKDITWNGIPAKAVKISYSYDTINWWDEYKIFAVNGEYRYYTEFAYSNKMIDKKGVTFEELLLTMSVDFSAIEKNFGQIPDEFDLEDRTATASKTSTKYGYSITVPKHWTATKKDLESNEVEFRFSGGHLLINVIEDVQDVAGYFRNVENDLNNRNTLRVVENTTVTFAGNSARKFILEEKSNPGSSPNRNTAYLIAHNGNVYIVEGLYFLANETEVIVKQLEAALNSFKFN